MNIGRDSGASPARPPCMRIGQDGHSRTAVATLGLAVMMIAGLLVSPVASAKGEKFGPQFLVRLQLERRPDFDRALSLALEPVYREGNTFYFVLDGADLARINEVHLLYNVVREDAPVRTRIDARSGAGPVIPPISLRYLESQMDVQVAALGDDPLVDTIAKRVSRDSLLSFGHRLEAFHTRYTFTDSCVAAQEYLAEMLRSFGYRFVRIDTFYVHDWSRGFFHGPWGHNVICTKLGEVEPGRIILLGAHYDSEPMEGNDPLAYAPGGDNNASGIAAVLEAARILADIPTRKTIVFAFFGAGEQNREGSRSLARALETHNLFDVDLMINLDQIAFTSDAHPDVNIGSDEPSIGYARLAVELGFLKTKLKPRRREEAELSDWQAFSQSGFNWIDISEGDYNPWVADTDQDRIERLDPAYWADVTRIAALTAYSTASTPSTVQGLQVRDVGNGRDLEVRWEPMPGDDISGYRVYWGPAVSNFPQHFDVLGGETVTVIAGLTEGTNYAIGVAALTEAGQESVVRSQVTLAPQRLPRPLSGVFGDAELDQIRLVWDAPVALDIAYYRIYRGTDSSSLSLYVDEWQDVSYADYATVPRLRYYYRIIAVDEDGNESPPSELTSAIAATFDLGVLILDMTSSSVGNPEADDLEAFYTAVFEQYRHEYYRYDGSQGDLDKSLLGRFRTAIWIDDDHNTEGWTADQWAKMSWFLAHKNDLVIVGWQTLKEVARCRITCEQNQGDFLYDWFDIVHIQPLLEADCIGAYGVRDYPDIAIDSAKVLPYWEGKLGLIWGINPQWPATVLLAYKSATANANREMYPVAIRRQWKSNKMVFISLPLYFWELADAQAFMATLLRTFEQPTLVAGDLDADSRVGESDIAYILNVVYRGLVPIGGYEYVDLNGDCRADLLDVVLLMDYVFHGYPEPTRGCTQ